MCSSPEVVTTASSRPRISPSPGINAWFSRRAPAPRGGDRRVAGHDPSCARWADQWNFPDYTSDIDLFRSCLRRLDEVCERSGETATRSRSRSRSGIRATPPRQWSGSPPTGSQGLVMCWSVSPLPRTEISHRRLPRRWVHDPEGITQRERPMLRNRLHCRNGDRAVKRDPMPGFGKREESCSTITP